MTKQNGMKTNLKYIIWLRNILAFLLAIVLIDMLVKRYYDHITIDGIRYGPILGFCSLLLLQYYIQQERRGKG